MVTPSAAAGTSSRPRTGTPTIDRMPVLEVPQPYDFVASTERFRAYGPDRANVWHDGGLHRVVDGREVRVAPVEGGVSVEPWFEAAGAAVGWQLGLSLDLDAFWAWARDEPVLAALGQALRGYRPPLVSDPWEMLVTSITAQQVSLHSAFAVRSRLIERFGERYDLAWAFPARERIAAAREEQLVEVGFSRRKAEYVVGLARHDLDLAELARLSDEDVVSALTAVRGIGRWTADWYLARALGRPDAWPAGDLGVRKAVSFFYGEGRDAVGVGGADGG